MAEEEQQEAPAKGGKGKLIIMIVAGIVLAGGGIFAGPMVQSMIAGEPEAVAEEGEVDVEPPKKEAIYQGIHPPLLINFMDDRGRSRFLQMSLELMARDQSIIDAIEAHNAVIRNNLILLYGDVKIEDLNGRDGKTKMLDQALEEINNILVEQTGEGGVEAVYFTNLVVQ
ncbi:MAG: flagellar basal body-associated FliL family protein [Pseudomonadota bacterium]